MIFNYLKSFEDEGLLPLFLSSNRGVERESLRVDINGSICLDDHPKMIGHPLTHSMITTDYSESLIELITPPFHCERNLKKSLDELTAFTIKNLDKQMLWPFSMPPHFKSLDEIKIAKYGNSNAGTMKHIYRKGLEYRYGKAMQIVAGVHFNYSFQGSLIKKRAELLNSTVSESYLDIIRNLQRDVWSLFYFCGGSPALDSSYINLAKAKTKNEFLKLENGNVYLSEYGTTLRMSDLGYRNDIQRSINVSYNGLEDYVAGLISTVTQEHPDYQQIFDKHGASSQLNKNLLQIENEFYALFRPKRVTKALEAPSLALKTRGVEYVEVRALDLNPYCPTGICLNSMKLLDLVLMKAYFGGAKKLDQAEVQETKDIQESVIWKGRDPKLMIRKAGKSIEFKVLKMNFIDELNEFAKILDQLKGDKQYTKLVERLKEQALDPEKTLSGKLTQDIQKEGYHKLGLRLANKHLDYFRNINLSENTMKFYNQSVTDSFTEEEYVKSQDTESFDLFLEKYFTQFN